MNGGHCTVDGIRIDAESGHAIELTEMASGITVRNSLISGMGTGNGTGIIAHGECSVEGSRIARFEAGVEQASGP